MEEQLNKADETTIRYECYTKRIETIISIVVIALFFLSFSKSIFSIYSIAFYVITLGSLLYYIIWLRKKPAYLTIGKDNIIVSSNMFFKMEEIRKDAIKKVNITDRKIEIHYLKEGVENKVSIFNVLLENKDKEEIIKYLQGIGK